MSRQRHWPQLWLEDLSFLKKCSFYRNGQHCDNDWWGCSQCRCFHRRQLSFFFFLLYLLILQNYIVYTIHITILNLQCTIYILEIQIKKKKKKKRNEMNM